MFSIAILAILFVSFSSIVTYAAETLSNFTVTPSKTKIAPGETVTVTVNFGASLSSYTVDVAYDKNLFDYVSAEGGTANDNGTRVRVYYFDQAGGENKRNSTTVTLKAKTGLTTLNPTSFDVTAEGLASVTNNVTTEYVDITTPIKKSVTVGKETTSQTTNNNTNKNQTTTKPTTQNTTATQTPTTMPKTGGTVYAVFFTTLGALGIAYVAFRTKQ